MSRPETTADPSFIAVWDATHAVAGGGGFRASDAYRFNPSSLTAPNFIATGCPCRTYSGVFRDANSLYLAGATAQTPRIAISYLDLNTDTSKVIIDNISTYSCGFAQDAAGDLYVGDEDNRNVYKFTAAQLNLAISGTPLAITDGTFVTNSSTGWAPWRWMPKAASGRRVFGVTAYRYMILADTETTVIPGLTNANYMVTTFSVGGQGYVAYTDEANPGQAGTAQYYGFEAVPEPGTFGLAVAGLAALAVCRRKQGC